MDKIRVAYVDHAADVGGGVLEVLADDQVERHGVRLGSAAGDPGGDIRRDGGQRARAHRGRADRGSGDRGGHRLTVRAEDAARRADAVPRDLVVDHGLEVVGAGAVDEVEQRAVNVHEGQAVAGLGEQLTDEPAANVARAEDDSFAHARRASVRR